MEGFLYGLNDTDLGLYSVTSNNNESDFDLENITGKGISGGGPSGTVTEWSAARIQRVITLTILMTVSFIGNSVIIFILFCSRYHKQLNRVKIFIINLAIGDLAVCCITMSSELMFEIFQEWKLGNAGCKIITYTQIVTLSSTTYILMGMSWDRYKAICTPLDFNPSTTKARRIVAAAWIAALVLAIPNLFIYVQVEHVYKDGTSVFYCHSAGYTADWQKKLNFIWLTCSALIFPAFWIAYCYFSVARVVWQQGNCQQMAAGDGFTLLRKTCDIRVIPRAKIKTMKMSLTIVITFVVCWTPYFVVYNIRVFSDYKYNIPESLMVLADTLALMNSAVNPIIYGCFNLRIRQGLQEACCFNLNVHSDKSRLSEPSCSTSSTARVRGTIRRPISSSYHGKTSIGATSSTTTTTAITTTSSALLSSSKQNHKRIPHSTSSTCETEFEFVQSTRHIQNKRSQILLQQQQQQQQQQLQSTKHNRSHNNRPETSQNRDGRHAIITFSFRKSNSSVTTTAAAGSNNDASSRSSSSGSSSSVGSSHNGNGNVVIRGRGVATAGSKAATNSTTSTTCPQLTAVVVQAHLASSNELKTSE